MYCAPQDRLPQHKEHHAERLGLFVMLLLGESIISLILPALVSAVDRYL